MSHEGYWVKRGQKFQADSWDTYANGLVKVALNSVMNTRRLKTLSGVQ